MDVSGKGMQPDSLRLYTAGKKKKLSEALVILINFKEVTELPFKNPENS